MDPVKYDAEQRPIRSRHFAIVPLEQAPQGCTITLGGKVFGLQFVGDPVPAGKRPPIPALELAGLVLDTEGSCGSAHAG